MRVVIAIVLGLVSGAVFALGCGDDLSAPSDELGYDNGQVTGALTFPGANAGDPDRFFGVRFELGDFRIPAGHAQVVGWCASNQIDFTGQGGPWANEVFLHRDLDGIPDLDNPICQGTMVTGDGTGWAIHSCDEPWVLDEAVAWLIVRGDPQHAGQEFNIEHDSQSFGFQDFTHSWVADNGLASMTMGHEAYMLRLVIRPTPAAELFRDRFE